jgi:ferredoxin
VQAGAEVTALVEIRSCLAALGAAAYVGLAALGVAAARVRVEACGDCPIGALGGAIAQSTTDAATLTAMPIMLEAAPAVGYDKPQYVTHAPRVTRRSFWRRLTGDLPAPASPLLAPEAPAAGKQPPPERRALLRGLAELPERQRAQGPFFPSFTATPACTACGVCANICPTGALAFGVEDEAFSLQFAPLACTGCGLCTQFCAPQALQPAAAVAYADAQPTILLAGKIKLCRRCRASFAGTGELCPACAFRRQHPAGSAPRPLASGGPPAR